MRHLAKWAAEVRIGSWSCENVENGAAGYQVVVVVALGSARGRNRFATDSPLERAGFELPVPRGVRSDSPLEGGGFELVWGFSCQVVLFGLLPVLCSERDGAVLHPVAYDDQVPGARGMGSRDRNASKAWRLAA